MPSAKSSAKPAKKSPGRKKKAAASVSSAPPYDYTPSDPAKQVSLLVENMDSYQKHSIDCFICMSRDSVRGMSEVDYATALYAEGWRIIDSDSLKSIGVACPKCVAMPDEQRGEE